MIITLALAGLPITYGIYRKSNADKIKKEKLLKEQEQKFKNTWKLCMKYSGVKNKNEETFAVLEYFPKNYGCDAIIGIPIGMDYNDLLKQISTLEVNYGAIIISNLSQSGESKGKTAYIRVAYDLSNANKRTQTLFKWNKIMMNNNNLMNKNNQTFMMANFKENEKYGFDMEVSIPDGLSYKNLESAKDILNSNFKSKVIQKWLEKDNKILLKVIENELPDDYKFVPIKTDVDKLYLGMTYDYQPVIGDLKIQSHMIYTGMNNTGKTVCMFTALTNMIYWHTEKEWELYISMISNKKDLRIFRNVKQCKYYADSLSKLYLLLKHLKKIILDRNNAFNSITEEDIVNIYEWNKKFPRGKMKQIIFAMDEMSYIMSDSLDSESEADLKNKCRDIINELYKEGRNVGIHILSCLQRPDKESFPPRFKAQIGIKICFKQPNDASSLVVLDTTEATDLKPQREAIVDMGEKYLMKTLYLTNDMIKQYISKSIEENHEYLDLENQTNANKPNQKNNSKEQNKNNTSPKDKKSTDRIKINPNKSK